MKYKAYLLYCPNGSDVFYPLMEYKAIFSKNDVLEVLSDGAMYEQEDLQQLNNPERTVWVFETAFDLWDDDDLQIMGKTRIQIKRVTA